MHDENLLLSGSGQEALQCKRIPSLVMIFVGMDFLNGSLLSLSISMLNAKKYTSVPFSTQPTHHAIPGFDFVPVPLYPVFECTS